MIYEIPWIKMRFGFRVWGLCRGVEGCSGIRVSEDLWLLLLFMGVLTPHHPPHHHHHQKKKKGGHQYEVVWALGFRLGDI